MNVTVSEFLDGLWHFDKSILFIKDDFLDAVDDDIRNGVIDKTLNEYVVFALDFKYVTMQTKYYLNDKFVNAKVSAFNVIEEGMIVFVEVANDSSPI